jgi:hypothetical protein
MNKLIYLLLLLPSIAFSCPDLTGNYHCDVKKHDTGSVSSFDVRFETNENRYTISILNAAGIPPLNWVADGTTKDYVAPIEDGVIYHSFILTCEYSKLHLIEFQNWYHDQTAETLKPGDEPSRAVALSEFIYLDADGNLLRDDIWTTSTMGTNKTEIIPLVCNKIKE